MTANSSIVWILRKIK